MRDQILKQQDRLNALRKIICLARDEALLWRAKLNVINAEQKGPGDFVSEADRQMEIFIQDLLNDKFPNEAIMGEEGGGELKGLTWVIDPIDGTSNFLNGSPLWGISIGLVENEKAILGAIVLPQLNVGLIGGTDYGLFDLDNNPVTRKSPAAPTMGIGTNIHQSNEEYFILIQTLSDKGFQPVAYRCGTVSLLFAAMGWISGYYEERTNIWDIAGGWPLCVAAGLHVEGKILGKPSQQWISVGVRSSTS